MRRALPWPCAPHSPDNRRSTSRSAPRRVQESLVVFLLRSPALIDALAVQSRSGRSAAASLPAKSPTPSRRPLSRRAEPRASDQVHSGGSRALGAAEAPRETVVANMGSDKAATADASRRAVAVGRLRHTAV